MIPKSIIIQSQLDQNRVEACRYHEASEVANGTAQRQRSAALQSIQHGEDWHFAA